MGVGLGRQVRGNHRRWMEQIVQVREFILILYKV